MNQDGQSAPGLALAPWVVAGSPGMITASIIFPPHPCFLSLLFRAFRPVCWADFLSRYMVSCVCACEHPPLRPRSGFCIPFGRSPRHQFQKSKRGECCRLILEYINATSSRITPPLSSAAGALYAAIIPHDPPPFYCCKLLSPPAP